MQRPKTASKPRTATPARSASSSRRSSGVDPGDRSPGRNRRTRDDRAACVPACRCRRGPLLAFDIRRDGSRSVYGDLAVTFTPRGGAPIDVGKAGGVAVYVPNPLRRARLPLQLPPGATLAGGTLRLSYRERADTGGKLIAESTLVLP
jgi:hypothetical protein